MSVVVSFPLGQVIDWREENRRKAEINRIDAQIRAKEQQMANLAHDVWLLQLEKKGLSNG
jgi:hypothetical protein